MTTDPQDSEDNTPEQEEESIAARSKRLEEEAARGAYDPLAPEPLLPPELQAQDEDNEDLADRGDSEAVKILQDQLDDTKEQMLRAVAEAENTRRRARKERDEAGKFAIANFARDILDVADNLRRALEATPTDLAENEPRLKNLIDGIEATERELLKNFEKHQIKKLNPTDEIFDPNFHEVMVEIPGTGKPPGTVVEVIETGYVIHDRLLRPARVGVAKDDGGALPTGEDTPDPGSQIDIES